MTAAAGVAGRIGPNAILRVQEALRAAGGAPLELELLDAAGLRRYAQTPPQAMVPEAEVARLHQTLWSLLPVQEARALAHAAGLATADYLLAHRIPRVVQRGMRLLPAGLAARVLLRAVMRHAWTFAGSGRFTAQAGMPVRIAITANPVWRGAVQAPMPRCAYHVAVFERLFRVLVHPGATVVETECVGAGAQACRFEVRWG